VVGFLCGVGGYHRECWDGIGGMTGERWNGWELGSFTGLSGVTIQRDGGGRKKGRQALENGLRLLTPAMPKRFLKNILY
jgi:hypothetical protein